MKSSVHSALAVVGLIVLIFVSCLLDLWINAAGARTELNQDFSWAWAKIISRLTLSALLLACAAFVLYPPRPNRLVAAIYLLSGTFLASTAHPMVFARLMLVSSEWFLFQYRSIALPTTGSFLVVIGMASFLRRRICLGRISSAEFHSGSKTLDSE